MNNDAKVSIIMGSTSDLHVMSDAAGFLEECGISYEMLVVSAHRTPERMVEFATTAESRGIKVIIAGAGGAAHLPGMVASMTILPVIGVPVKSSNSLDGWDSLLSIAQMPGGVPVATMAVNGARNAGILASQIIALHDSNVSAKLKEHKKKLQNAVIDSSRELQEKGYRYFLKSVD
jgi:5-(carboxyamino)imidazole ribonucleotide mutase